MWPCGYLISITFEIIWASIKLTQEIATAERVQPAHLLHFHFLLQFRPMESGNNRQSCSFLQSSFLESEVFPNRRCHSPGGMSVFLQQSHHLYPLSQAAHTVIKLHGCGGKACANSAQASSVSTDTGRGQSRSLLGFPPESVCKIYTRGCISNLQSHSPWTTPLAREGGVGS